MSDYQEIKLVWPKKHLRKARKELYQDRHGASSQRPRVQCDSNCPVECHRSPEIRKKPSNYTSTITCIIIRKWIFSDKATGVEEQDIFPVLTQKIYASDDVTQVQQNMRNNIKSDIHLFDDGLTKSSFLSSSSSSK